MKDYREFLEEDPIHFEAEYEAEQAHRALQEYSGYMDGHELLEAYGFDMPETVNAEAPHPAEEAAVNVGYPIVMKINSPDVSHKTDLDGIRKNVQDRQEVNDSFHEIINNIHHEKPGSEIKGVIIQEQVEGLEVALGMKRDPQFGPMIMVGLGGIYVEALQDISFGIAPISEQEAVRMVEELDSSDLFEGFRGEKHSIKPVKEAIIKLGELALNHEEIQEIDINPLILKKDKAYAADIELELE
jgi:acetyltransferase